MNAMFYDRSWTEVWSGIECDDHMKQQLQALQNRLQLVRASVSAKIREYRTAHCALFKEAVGLADLVQSEIIAKFTPRHMSKVFTWIVAVLYPCHG